MKRIKNLIREYVMDHYKHFGFYPMDVEVDEVLYTYEHYMRILSMPVGLSVTLKPHSYMSGVILCV